MRAESSPPHSAHAFVTTRERPELAEVTGRWRWDAFFRQRGGSLEEMLVSERIAANATSPMPTTIVLLDEGEPIGMASLAEHDLDDRPDLTPWLAGVFVLETARGRGHAARLVAAVEEVARGASIPTLWLYTSTAERIYARAGWTTAELFRKDGKDYALMRRALLG